MVQSRYNRIASPTFGDRLPSRLLWYERDAALNSEHERIERDVDDLLASAVPSAKAGSAPRDRLSRHEYVAGRVRRGEVVSCG